MIKGSIFAAEPKSGSVQYDEVENYSIPASCKVGLSFNRATIETDLPSVSLANDWYKIPAWLAGSWRSKEATLISQTNLRTGKKSDKPFQYKINELAHYGWFQDKDGGIWQAVASGVWTKNAYPEKTYERNTYFLTSRLVDSNSEKSVYKSRSINFDVDKQTNRIIKSWYCTTVRTLNKVSENTIVGTDVSKNYSPSGEFEVESVNKATMEKESPFQETIETNHVDQVNQLSARKSFISLRFPGENGPRFRFKMAPCSERKKQGDPESRMNIRSISD